jgi:hypothetical protein
MKPSEIILNDKEAIKAGAQKVLKAIGELVQQKAAVLLQDGNSVLVLVSLGNGEVELHLYTVDQPLAVARSVKTFIQKIRNSDLKAVYGTAPMDSPVVKMLEMQGVDVQESNKNDRYNWMAKV